MIRAITHFTRISIAIRPSLPIAFLRAGSTLLTRVCFPFSKEAEAGVEA
jgi:hypothetical protein